MLRACVARSFRDHSGPLLLGASAGALPEVADGQQDHSDGDRGVGGARDALLPNDPRLGAHRRPAHAQPGRQAGLHPGLRQQPHVQHRAHHELFLDHSNRHARCEARRLAAI